MIARMLGRLITGPLAFLVAGAIDVAAAWTRWALARARARVVRARLAGVRVAHRSRGSRRSRADG